VTTETYTVYVQLEPPLTLDSIDVLNVTEGDLLSLGTVISVAVTSHDFNAGEVGDTLTLKVIQKQTQNYGDDYAVLTLNYMTPAVINDFRYQWTPKASDVKYTTETQPIFYFQTWGQNYNPVSQSMETVTQLMSESFKINMEDEYSLFDSFVITSPDAATVVNKGDMISFEIRGINLLNMLPQDIQVMQRLISSEDVVLNTTISTLTLSPDGTTATGSWIVEQIEAGGGSTSEIYLKAVSPHDTILSETRQVDARTIKSIEVSGYTKTICAGDSLTITVQTTEINGEELTLQVYQYRPTPGSVLQTYTETVVDHQATFQWDVALNEGSSPPTDGRIYFKASVPSLGLELQTSNLTVLLHGIKEGGWYYTTGEPIPHKTRLEHNTNVLIKIITAGIPNGIQTEIDIWEWDYIADDYVQTLVGTVNNNVIEIPWTAIYTEADTDEAELFFEASIPTIYGTFSLTSDEIWVLDPND